MRGLKDKVVIVTGAAQGIGAAVTRRLAEEGAKLVLADLNFDGVATLATNIEAAGGEALAVTLNVADRGSWESAIEAVFVQYGRIDALVNNAGVTRDRTLLKMTDEDWETVINVNLRGTWLGCQLVVPHLRTAGGGSIVNLSSESRWGTFGQANYSSAKSGIVGLTRTVAFEHARHKIRANAVAPGSTLTEMVKAVPEEIRSSWLDAIPMQRMADPSEIASSVAYLLSEDASYVTGQVLGVNGGSSL